MPSDKIGRRASSPTACNIRLCIRTLVWAAEPKGQIKQACAGLVPLAFGTPACPPTLPHILIFVILYILYYFSLCCCSLIIWTLGWILWAEGHACVPASSILGSSIKGLVGTCQPHAQAGAAGWLPPPGDKGTV